MRVLFKENVINVWRAWEIKDVSDGYARNFLIPQKKAVAITKKQEEEIIKKEKLKEQKRRELIENKAEIIKKINNENLIFKVKKWQNWKIFGSIWEKDILNKLNKKFNINLEKKHIKMMDWHIKKTWTFDVYVKLWENNIAKIKVTVE